MGSRAEGFPPQRRLRASKEFGRVFASPTRAADHYFTVLARPNELGIARLGLAISRRAAKRAVDRNKLKRIARESFRHQSLPGWDFVVTARPGAKTATLAELRASIDALFAQIARRAERRSRG